MNDVPAQRTSLPALADPAGSEIPPGPLHLFEIALQAARNLTQVEVTALLEIGAMWAWDRRLTDQEILDVDKHAQQVIAFAQRQPPVSMRDQIYLLLYRGLSARSLTWTDAARIASGQLGETLKPDTFRKRLVKWTAEKGLPPVAQRRPRS